MARCFGFRCGGGFVIARLRLALTKRLNQLAYNISHLGYGFRRLLGGTGFCQARSEGLKMLLSFNGLGMQ